MPFPTFAPGDVLNDSDMNAVGLWLVKTQTIGTTVSSVPVADVFSADYDNYRVVVSGGAGSTNLGLNLTFGTTSTGYYRSLMSLAFNSGTITSSSAENQASISAVGSAGANGISMIADILNPFDTTRTIVNSHQIRPATGANGGITWVGGFLDDATSYTAFTLTTSTGTLTGGTIRVYGYRD